MMPSERFTGWADSQALAHFLHLVVRLLTVQRPRSISLILLTTSVDLLVLSNAARPVYR